MYWVVQQDMFQDNQRNAIIDTLERFEIPYQLVSIDGNNNLVPEVTYEGSIITNGSIMLSNIAISNNWTPGAFMNNNFTYEVWFEHFKDHLLNRDAVFSTIRDAVPLAEKFFIRPLRDDKEFNGHLTTLEQFRNWQHEILCGKNRSISADMQILYATPKPIGQEHRHYIVDGEVISSSRYKLNGVVNLSSNVDAHIIDFVKQMINIWTPARAFVMDTYVSGEEIGIVEIGCICNAGFYAADVQKIVMALDSMLI